jgi:hypothetical protein
LIQIIKPGGNRRAMLGVCGIAGPTIEHGRAHIGAEAPTRPVINITFVVRPVQPADHAVVPSTPVAVILTEFAGNNRVGCGGHRHIRIPSRRAPRVDMGGVNNPLAASRFRQSAICPPRTTGAAAGHPLQVIGPSQSPCEDHVVGARSADSVQQSL